MGLLDHLWDDVAGGSPPEKGLKQLRREKSSSNVDFPNAPNEPAKRVLDKRLSSEGYPTSQTIAIKKPQTLSPLSTESPVGTPSSLGSTPPASPALASPSYTKEKDNIWRSVFHPGQNKMMRKVGSDKFDKAQANSPSVYDWVVITALDK